MKKVIVIIAIVLILCILAVVLVKCNNGNNGDTNGGTANKGQSQVSDNSISKTFDKPDFKDEAGYSVVKSDSLSKIKYDGIQLLDGANGQLDLTLDGDKKATLLIKKSEDYIDEEGVKNIKIGDYEVKLSEGLDSIDRYYWKKDKVNYVLSFNKNTGLSDEEILKIIEGFSIEVGENY